MTIADYCLFAAVLLYLLTLAPAKFSPHSPYDNGDPRSPEFYREPRRARILGAHNNGVETFPFFAVAVLLAEFRVAPQGWIDALAVLFLLVRLAYVAVYIGDRPTMRSIIWTAGFAINTAIFFLPAFRR